MEKEENEKIKVGVIGLVDLGQHHARVYSQLEEVNLIAVADLNEKKGRKVAQRYGCKYYRDYNLMLDKEDIEALSIDVAVRLHKKVALDVISRKKHLLIEEPLALNTQEAGEIVREAKRAGVKLMVAHIERFNPAVQKLREVIEKGELGKITSIIVRRVGIFPPHPRVYDDVIVGLAIHDIDVLNYLLEERQPVKVFVRGRKILKDTKGEDSADIFLAYDKINCFLQVNWVTPGKIREISVTGLKAYARLNCLGQELAIYKARSQKEIKNFQEFVKLGQPLKKAIAIEKQEPLFNEIKSFIDCLRQGQEPLVAGKQGLEALIIVEKIRKSLNNNYDSLNRF